MVERRCIWVKREVLISYVLWLCVLSVVCYQLIVVLRGFPRVNMAGLLIDEISIGSEL